MTPREQAIERMWGTWFDDYEMDRALDNADSPARLAEAALDSLSPDLLLALALTEDEVKAMHKANEGRRWVAERRSHESVRAKLRGALAHHRERTE